MCKAIILPIGCWSGFHLSHWRWEISSRLCIVETEVGRAEEQSMLQQCRAALDGVALSRRSRHSNCNCNSSPPGLAPYATYFGQVAKHAGIITEHNFRSIHCRQGQHAEERGATFNLNSSHLSTVHNSTKHLLIFNQCFINRLYTMWRNEMMWFSSEGFVRKSARHGEGDQKYETSKYLSVKHWQTIVIRGWKLIPSVYKLPQWLSVSLQKKLLQKGALILQLPTKYSCSN